MGKEAVAGLSKVKGKSQRLNGGVDRTRRWRWDEARLRVKVGFIGLGAMGLPMAKRVAGGGHETFTVARRRARTGR